MPIRWLQRQLDVLGADTRQALRSLGRNPLMTAAAIGTLALAIGLTTLTFGVVYATTARPLPYEDPEELVEIAVAGRPAESAWRIRLGVPAFEELGGIPDSFDGLGEFAEHTVTIADERSSRLVPGAQVTPGLFEILGVGAILGRTFAADDGRPAAAPTVILGDRLWRTRFGADPAVLGETLNIDGVLHTVIGVMPPRFSFPYWAQLWIPRDRDRERYSEIVLDSLVVRLRDGVTLERAHQELAPFEQKLAAAGAEGIVMPPWQRRIVDLSDGWQFSIVARRLGSDRSEELGWLPFAAMPPVGLVLVVACANIAGLLLARGVARRHEMTVRSVLGGSRGRLVRQLLTESLLLALAAGALGLLFVSWSGRAIRLLAERFFREVFPLGFGGIELESPVPGWFRLEPDGVVVLFAIAVSAVVVVAIGLLPARETSRADLAAALRSGGYGATPGRRARRWQGTLTTSQLALSVVLAAAAVLTLRSASALVGFDLGMDVDRVIEVQMGPANPRGSELQDPRAAALELRAIERYRPVPGVESVSSSWLPEETLVERPFGNVESFLGVAAPETLASGALPAGVRINGRVVGPDYFRALGIRVLRGRAIGEQDRRDAPPVAVVSESTAEAGWPGEEPLGRQIRLRSDGISYTVVGLVEDLRRAGALDPRGPRALHHVYVAAAQVGAVPQALFVRAAGDTPAVAERLRRVTHELDPSVVFAAQRPSGTEDEAIMVPVFRWSGLVFSALSLAALALSVIGIFGVIAYGAAQRTREMGLRAALGADRPTIVRLILREAMALAVVGIVLGTAASLAIGRLLAGFLYGVPPFDPATHLGVAVGIVLLALLAGWHPARRAAGVHPAVALRND